MPSAENELNSSPLATVSYDPLSTEDKDGGADAEEEVDVEFVEDNTGSSSIADEVKALGWIAVPCAVSNFFE